jgi:ABC-type transporter Mla subunit MlaD
MRRSQSAFLNPTLIGAITVLAAIVAVFLAYNANSGLPFVPTYDVHMQVPDAAELIVGNEVQIAGSHVGIVRDITPVVHQGVPYANVTLQLEKQLQPLPVDTSIQIRLRSNLGLKYVEIFPGHSRQGIENGGNINPSLIAPVVNLDDLFDIFNKPTRTAVQGVFSNLGDGFAGRGSDFNDALAALPPLTRNLTTVGKLLSSQRTDLAGFVQGLNSAATRVSPVAGQLADLFSTGATTFGAIAPNDLGSTIDQAAATEQGALPSLKPTTGLLKAGAAFLQAAQPGLKLLPTAAPTLSRTLAISGPPLARAGTLATGVTSVVAALERVAKLPDTTDALVRLTESLRNLVPTLQYVNPMQTQCNYVGLWTRNIDSTISQGDTLGTWFRATIIENPAEDLPSPYPSNTLHDVLQPDTGQNGSCTEGNQVYKPGQWIGAPPGTQPDHTESTIPGTLGQRVAAENGKP